MKKFVVLTLFGLLIFTSTASAQLQFKASGMIDFNTVWETNVPFYFGAVATRHGAHDGIFQTWITPAFNAVTGRPDNGLDRATAYSYSRGLLRFDAIVDKNLSGTIYFEMDAFRWGAGPGWNSRGQGGHSAGSAGGVLQIAGERNTMGVWSTDRAAVEVKNVYFDVGLPYFGIPVPMTVRIGAQPFGVRPRICVYTDGMGITGGIKVDPVTIIPMWAKVQEGLDWASDDADMYGLHVNAKIATFTVGGYGLFYKLNTYPLTWATGISWNTWTGVPGQNWPTPTSSSFGLYQAGTQRADFWWLGLYAEGKAGPINLSVDAVWDGGRVKQKNHINSDGTMNAVYVKDVKYSGWAGRLNIDFPWEKFNFGMTGMYATGADANKTSTGGLPGQPVANRAYGTAGVNTTRVGSYVTPPGSEQSPGANEAIVMYSCFNASADGGTGIANVSSYTQVSRGGFGGTAFLKGYASVKAAPWYKITLQGLYIWDTTRHGNTFGTAVKNPLAPYTLQFLKDDSDIGFELDLIQEIDIYKNLKWFVGAGYLFAGKALDVYNRTSPAAVPGTYIIRNLSPANPWNVTTRMIFTF